jgi:hypothetical protein
MHPSIRNIPHPTAEYLHNLASAGVPAYLADDSWTLAQLDSAIQRGSHKSTVTQFSQFIMEDMFDYVQRGTWIILPYASVHHLPNLHLAPADVVPQRE